MRWSSMSGGRLVKQAGQLTSGEPVRALLGRGEFTARVDRVKDEINNKWRICGARFRQSASLPGCRRILGTITYPLSTDLE